jgi:hypothetical protein
MTEAEFWEAWSILSESFFDLGGEFKGKSVETLCEIANVLKEVVVGDQGRDGGEKSGGGGDECFGDAGSDGAKAGRAGSAETGEGVNDAPNGAEETDEGSDACGGGKPGHALFDAPNFFGGGELHGDGDGLHGFQTLRGGIAGGAGELALQFAIAGGVDGRKRRAGGNEALGIGDPLRGAEDFQELVGFAADATEKARLLEDKRPGNQGKDEKKSEDEAGNPAGLRENFKDIADEDGGEQRDDVNPSRATEIW